MANYDDTATVSGSVVSISDGADEVGVKSCEVALSASLDGYSSVDVVQMGKNLLINNGVGTSGSGLSFVVNSDKSVTISGVATANAFFTFFENVLFKASSYMIRGSGNSNVKIIVRRGTASGSNIRTASTSDISWNLAEDTLCACVIRVASGTDLTTPITVYPQIEVGSSLSTYEMAISTTYTASLGRTIHGGTADVANGTGQGTHGKTTIYATDNWQTGYFGAGYRYYISGLSDMKTGQDCLNDMGITGVRFNIDNMQRINAYCATATGYDTIEKFKEALGNGVNLCYELATPTDFTFEPVEINSRLGDNTMWSEQGDMSVVYRSSGTVTPIQPTLITKSITENGTYSASDDDVDGYSEVVVNVPSPEPTVTPLNSPNAFLLQSGVSGTDVERTVRTETASVNGKYVFASDSTCRTNTGGGDGFLDIQKNGVSVVKQYMSANTTTDITIPDISVEAGDEITFIVGFDNAHSSCNFQLYTGIALVSESSAPSLLSMTPSEETNENTEEVEE